jgi:hypothetical protein
MSSLLQAADGSRLGELLPGKNKNNVSALVSHRHRVAKGILSRHPSDINTRWLINPRSGPVERLMAQGLNHPQQLWLGLLARHFRDKTDDSRHDLLGRLG